MDEFIQNILTFSLGGKDTTGQFLHMFLYYMGKYPDISKKLEKEILSLYSVEDKDFDFDNLKKMSYLEACVNEVLRYYGPGVFLVNRRAIKDHKIGNIEIKKDTVCNSSFLYNHFNPAYFDQPFEFRP